MILGNFGWPQKHESGSVLDRESAWSKLDLGRKPDPRHTADTSLIESDYRLWLTTLFPGTYITPELTHTDSTISYEDEPKSGSYTKSFRGDNSADIGTTMNVAGEVNIGGLASYHADYWDWLWAVRKGVMPRPYVAVWGRGAAKSTNAEVGAVALGTRGQRRYILYVCGTQPQADDHVGNIALLLESDQVAKYYPEHSVRFVGKFGNPRGWRRNRLSTAAGLTIDAVGLDVMGTRGVKLGNERPDVIIFDDIDHLSDGTDTIAKKIGVVTKTILPAGALDVAVCVAQNLVTRNGIVSQLVDGRADFLARAIVSGPHPLIADLEYEGVGKDAVITGGTPTWDVIDLAACQAKIGLMGLRAFLAECQHQVELSGQPRFSLDVLALMRTRTQVCLPARVLPASLQGIEGLEVWELPIPGVAYVAYTDPAEGKGRDYTASGIMDASSRRVVAVLEDNTREPQKHADIVCDLIEWYNDAFAGYERAKGEAHALVLGRRGIKRVYEHIDNPLTPQQRGRGQEAKRIPGFPMTEHSKRGLIDRLADRLEAYQVGVPSGRMIDQLGSYVVTERMTTQAEAGSHDDLVIMLAGLIMLSEEPGAQVLRSAVRRPVSTSYEYVAPGRR